VPSRRRSPGSGRRGNNGGTRPRPSKPDTPAMNPCRGNHTLGDEPVDLPAPDRGRVHECAARSRRAREGRRWPSRGARRTLSSRRHHDQHCELQLFQLQHDDPQQAMVVPPQSSPSFLHTKQVPENAQIESADAASPTSSSVGAEDSDDSEEVASTAHARRKRAGTTMHALLLMFQFPFCLWHPHSSSRVPLRSQASGENE
jgi:hypothetical protein